MNRGILEKGGAAAQKGLSHPVAIALLSVG